MSRVLVIGGGVAGLCCATTLAERGAHVTLLERSPELGGNASWLAGGMLAPFCEGESAPQSVVELGQGAIDWWDTRAPGVTREGTLVVAPPRDSGEIDRFATRTKAHAPVDEAGIAELEPNLAGRFRKGLFFADEGHLDPRVALAALTERLRAQGGEIRFGVDGEALGDARVLIDCRGWAAREALPELRGVRGEMMRIRSREVTLTRAVRFLHPRIPLYIVPRGGGVFMIGATMIESESRAGASVRSTLEMLSAAYALHPAFAEAEILEVNADLRPAFADNLPAVRRIGSRTHFVNGLFRHGFLLAPAMARQVADLVEMDNADFRQRRSA